MTLHAQTEFSIPEETIRVARAAYPHGNTLMKMRDALGTIYIDWKYLLGLELADPGFDASVLCEFRKRLVQGRAEHLLLDTLLALCKERGWLKARERQRTDSTHVLAKVRAMNRHMCVGEAMCFALNSLAVVAPDWLLAHGDAEWTQRYGHRIEESRLPKSEGDRLSLAELMGEELHQADVPPGDHLVDAG